MAKRARDSLRSRPIKTLVTWVTTEIERVCQIKDQEARLAEAQAFIAQVVERTAVLSRAEKQQLREKLWYRNRPMLDEDYEDWWEAIVGTIDGILE